MPNKDKQKPFSELVRQIEAYGLKDKLATLAHKQEAKRPPPQWAFITQEVREKFSPKKVRTRLRYKNQVEKSFFPVLKLNTPETISKLKFTFRHHNGRLVEFENQPFSFQLKFKMFV